MNPTKPIPHDDPNACPPTTPRPDDASSLGLAYWIVRLLSKPLKPWTLPPGERKALSREASSIETRSLASAARLTPFEFVHCRRLAQREAREFESQEAQALVKPTDAEAASLLVSIRDVFAFDDATALRVILKVTAITLEQAARVARLEGIPGWTRENLHAWTQSGATSPGYSLAHQLANQADALQGGPDKDAEGGLA